MQQLIQLKKPSQILRETKLEQAFNTLTDMKGGFCAKGVIMKYLGWNGEYNNDMKSFVWEAERIIGNLDVVGLNDKHKSFSEIADYLEHRGL